MKKSKRIYLDYAASASSNPSSIHFFGVEAKKKLENSREMAADILGTQSQNIIFTSGGTESNNLAIQGVVEKYLENFQNIPHIITTNIEHASVLETCRLLQKRKLAQISIVPVEPSGIIDPRKIRKEIKKNTVLISVMYANNEIGTIQPIREIVKGIRHYRKERNRFLPVFHTDAVQAANYLDLKVEKLGVDLLSLSGSKIEGGGSVGVLYKRKGIPFSNIFGGGDQEFGLRPGTENVAGIVGFAKALKIAEKLKEKENKRLTKLRDYFIDKLISKTVFDIGIKINGDLKNRLPNNINITIPKILSDLLVLELSARGIYVSEKSACYSGDKKGSYVIKALDPKRTGSLRFSLGHKTSKADIDYTLKALSEILQKLKKWYT
jgi:cysteine desulfurase